MQWHGLRLSLPDPSYFQFPPSSEPFPIPPPAPDSTLHAPPFQIPESIFHSVLDVRVPITIASVYAITVPIINRINKSRGNKPWAISKTKPFFWFVVLHNVFLAVYSAWTFVGMVGGLRRSLQRPDASTGLVGTVDSLCKINGVGGLGNALAFNQTTNTWTTHNPQIHLAEDGRPDPTDLGRIWNEGLAFYGWWFYLSKFYEVFDTIIILAKGKRSSTLQTYHHTGAMLCMWAGIRYMSPPIWMFVAWNSLIHAIMYSYYTVTAFNVRVPQAIKQTLTTMQIMQFIVGAPYAALHSFISYDIPVRVPTVRETISTALSSASSAVAAVATDPTVADTIKKILFRAAGEGGVADNLAPASVASPAPASSGHHHHIVHKYKDPEPSYTTEYRDVPCLNTQGATLAVWMNVFYLLPLTFLFGRFFVKSYITRTIGQGAKAKVKAIENSGKDAVKGVNRKLDEYLQPVDEQKKGQSDKKVAQEKKANEDKKEQQRQEQQKKQEAKKEQEKNEASKKEAEQRRQGEEKKAEQKQPEPEKEQSTPASTEKSKSNLSEKSEDFEKIEHEESSKSAQDGESDNEDDAAESASTPNTPSKKKKNKKKKKKTTENLVEANAPPPITPANVTAGVAEMSFAEAVKEDL